MRTFSKRLLAGTAGVLCFATVATALTLVVEYKPYGVPDHRRAEYEQKIEEMRQQLELLERLEDQARPKAVVPVSRHDFGLMDPHTTASHAFVVRNEGEHPLKLEVRETSCKCTVGKLAAGLLAPGEQTSVTLTWNTGNQADHYEQTATVITNDPLRESITLSVEGQVRAELVVPEATAFEPSDPAEVTASTFVVYSQLWEDFEVVDASCGLEAFEWYAEPISANHSSLVLAEARSAWQIRVHAAADDYGEFSDEIELTIQPHTGGDPIIRTIACSGRVRAPIGFYSPMLHREEGLDIGTVVSGTQHDFHVVVRGRGDVDRKLEVLDVEPKTLQTSLEPLSKPGTYRLTITIPEDCPLLVFNADQKHGYVQVGDPLDPRYSNWFPLYGAVVTVKQ